jgi:hypothetical protein
LKQLLNYPHKAEWTPFQTHYFSDDLVASGIEPRTSGFVARKLHVIHKRNNILLDINYFSLLIDE